MFKKKLIALALTSALVSWSSIGIAEESALEADIAGDGTITNITITLPKLLFNGGGVYTNVELTFDSPADFLKKATKFDADPNKIYEFRSVLWGGAENTPAMSMGGGIAKLKFNEMTGKLYGHVELLGLMDVTGAHVHFDPVNAGDAAIPKLIMIGGNGMMLIPREAMMLSAEQIASLKAGKAYVNVHTMKNPDGELRGNLNFNIGRTLVAHLTRDQEVDKTGVVGFPGSKGFGRLKLNMKTGALSGAFKANAVNGTRAHIHMGAAGKDGGVLVTLDEMGSATSMGFAMLDDMGKLGTNNWWVVPADTVLDAAGKRMMMKGNTYVNVHTDALPKGSIRGQIHAIKVD